MGYFLEKSDTVADVAEDISVSGIHPGWLQECLGICKGCLRGKVEIFEVKFEMCSNEAKGMIG